MLRFGPTVAPAHFGYFCCRVAASAVRPLDDTAQELFAQNGFRPVNPAILKKYASKYPVRPGVFTVDDKTIGGWRAADKRWFDPNHGVMAGIEKAVGGG